MPTIAQFKARVLGYVGRDISVFNDGTNDNVLEAMNDARREAQESYTFGQLKCNGGLYFNGSAGSQWKTPDAGGYGPYTTDNVSSTPYILNGIDTLWNYVKDNQGNLQPTNRIDLATPNMFRRLLPVNMGFPFSQLSQQQNPPYYFNTVPSQQTFAYVEGSRVYLNNQSQPVWIMFRGTQQLPDLDSDDTSDFFVDNYSTWLLWSTLQNLNGYLKDDQRVQISQPLLASSYDKMCFDDTQKALQGDDWSALD